MKKKYGGKPIQVVGVSCERLNAEIEYDGRRGDACNYTTMTTIIIIHELDRAAVV